MPPSRPSSPRDSSLDEKLLVLLDGHALVHRAFHAIKTPLSHSKTGEVTSGVYGFTSTLLKTLIDLRPASIAVTFDYPKPTFRHQRFAAYKAQRPSTPDELRQQFVGVRRIIEALGIPIYELEGYEADDLLGTLSAQATEKGLQTIIITGDTDTMQLVSPTVRIALQRSREVAAMFDIAAVRQRYGLEPSQIPDLKALVGDPSDNIPGVSGVGDKTATSLLQKHGTIEGVYQDLALVTPKTLQEKLREAEETAREGKLLTTIVCDLPVSLDLDACRWAEHLDRDRVLEVFRAYEFSSLLPRLNLLPGVAGPSEPDGAGSTLPVEEQGETLEEAAPSADVHQATLSIPVPAHAELVEGPGSPPTPYRIITTPEALDDLCRALQSAGRFAFDTETTGTDPIQARLVGLSFSWAPGAAAYLPLRHQEGVQLPVELVLARLRPLLKSEALEKAGHNLQYDISILAGEGVSVRGLAFDTMIAAHLLGEKGLGLKALAFQRLGVEMTPITQLIGTGRKQITMAQVPIAQAAPYAAADADMTLRLADLLAPELERAGQRDLFDSVEMPLVTVLMRMERHGILVDVARLRQMSQELGDMALDLEASIYNAVGHKFNIGSPKQLGDVLFEELHLPHVRRTATGAYSTDAAILEDLKKSDGTGVVARILEYREITKLKSTYLDAFPTLINPQTRRLHTNFNQTGAATGRISSSEPNLQNIPIRTDLGRRIRYAFVAPPGSQFLGADYSQIELRVLAHLSQDLALMEAFHRDEDIHASTASAVLKVPRDQVTPDMRRIAKPVNFGFVYGMSGFGDATHVGGDLV
ncbi:MAG: DNA polymerase I, partial [Chloroflexi bacterium]|nr:DNA polymerase I [Chloroflexota bacterium]